MKRNDGRSSEIKLGILLLNAPLNISKHPSPSSVSSSPLRSLLLRRLLPLNKFSKNPPGCPLVAARLWLPSCKVSSELRLAADCCC